ncbi:unnamed protein product [Calypogeia fissa]
MEGLERLQSVHTTLGLMREHELCSTGTNNSSDALIQSAGLASDRFISDFFIFLSKTSSNAEELKERCDILMSTLPKVSITFLQALAGENSTLGGGQDAVKIPNTGCKSLVGKSPEFPSPIAGHIYPRYDEKDSTMIFTSENTHGYELHTRNSPPEGISEGRPLASPLASPLAPVVGLKAMERASTTLEDFYRSYFMFHDMDVRNPQQLFKSLPILSFVEAFIYQLDEENEERVKAQSSGCEACFSDSSNQNSQGAAHSLVGRRCRVLLSARQTCDAKQDSSSKSRLETHQFRGLEDALADHGLLTERIIAELRDGVEYWSLERALCEAVRHGDPISSTDIFTAIELKSFDYRVLNLLLYSSTGREVNEAHFNFLAVSELLVEISDDLYDYEDDVLKNSFNVLRMLVKVYGPAKAPEILAKFISEQEVMYQQLLDGLEPDLAKKYRERCKEATHEGGGGSKHQFGSWTIPPLIVDEEAFRTIYSASPHSE